MSSYIDAVLLHTLDLYIKNFPLVGGLILRISTQKTPHKLMLSIQYWPYIKDVSNPYRGGVKNWTKITDITMLKLQS